MKTQYCGLLMWVIQILNFWKSYGTKSDFTLLILFLLSCLLLRIPIGKKHHQIKHLQKVWVWTFGSLVHQINSLKEVLKLKQNFHKNKVVTGRTSFFVIGLFCTHHFFCLNIGVWYGSFVWKWCVFNFSAFN